MRSIPQLNSSTVVGSSSHANSAPPCPSPPRVSAITQTHTQHTLVVAALLKASTSLTKQQHIPRRHTHVSTHQHCLTTAGEVVGVSGAGGMLLGEWGCCFDSVRRG